MNSYGIQAKLIKWFENYLFKRRQKVINKNSWSSFEPVSAGVPQGSVSLCQTLSKALEKSQKTKQQILFFLESLGSKCIVLIVDGQWNVLAKTPIGIYI
jgi:hypothetical protein